MGEMPPPPPSRKGWKLAVGVALWLSLIVAAVVGLWLGGSCAMVRKYRPPLVAQVGTAWAPPARHQEDMAGIARVIMPTRPVGVWSELRYGFGEQRVDSVAGGVTIFLPGGDFFQQPPPQRDVLPPDALEPLLLPAP